MTVPIGVTWVLSARKYFIVGVVFSISTFGLFSDSNDGLRTRVGDSAAATLAMSTLGRMKGKELEKDEAAAAVVSPSLREQDGHTALICAAGNAVALSFEDSLTVVFTKPYLCRRRTGVLYELIIRPLPQTFLRFPKRLDSGMLAVLFLGICN